VLDSAVYDNGKPIVFYGKPNGNSESKGRGIAQNSQNNGQGLFSFTDAPNISNTDNMYTVNIVGANNGTFSFYSTFSICDGTGLNYGWNGVTVDGIDSTIIESNNDACNATEGVQNIALVIRAIDDIPLSIWTRSKSLYVGINSETDGTGTWEEYPLRIVTNSIDITGGSNSLVQLSSGGFAAYYFQRRVVAQKIVSTWEYSHTTDTTGTAGWVHQTIYTSNKNRKGVIGVDGNGVVFIANTMDQKPGGYAGIEVMLGVDTMGTSFTSITTIFFDSSCTLVGINRRRAVIMADGTPGFLATCQNQRIFLIKSLHPTAGGPWGIHKIIYHDAAFSAIDPTIDTSLQISGGEANPHIVYRRASNDNIVFVQSLLPDSF
jgi:hypothetical protein